MIDCLTNQFSTYFRGKWKFSGMKELHLGGSIKDVRYLRSLCINVLHSGNLQMAYFVTNCASQLVRWIVKDLCTETSNHNHQLAIPSLRRCIWHQELVIVPVRLTLNQWHIWSIATNGNVLRKELLPSLILSSIQVMWYDSVVVGRQNVQITSILTDFTLGSWKDFDVGLSLIGSKK